MRKLSVMMSSSVRPDTLANSVIGLPVATKNAWSQMTRPTPRVSIVDARCGPLASPTARRVREPMQ